MNEIVWEKIFQIIKEFSLPEEVIVPDELLADALQKVLPTDKEFSLVEFKNKVPRCIIWPEYSSALIPLFNSELNKNIPQVYNPLSKILGPVKWSNYSHTEYDRRFNRPLNIGYSLGIGIHEPIHDRELIFNLHKSRNSDGFMDHEIQVMTLIRPIIQSIYNRRYRLLQKNIETISPRELSPGCTNLSRREREVLEYLLTRESIREIAENLKLSPRTIETHSLHIYQKLCISTRKDLRHIMMKEKT